MEAAQECTGRETLAHNLLVSLKALQCAVLKCPPRLTAPPHAGLQPLRQTVQPTQHSEEVVCHRQCMVKQHEYLAKVCHCAEQAGLRVQRPAHCRQQRC